jgi:non-heme chloroperoxidase
MAFEVESVELPGGVSLQYVEHGDPAGIPVLLLHGLGDSWHSYELILPRLPETIRAIAPSQRGHGDSSRPATGYRLRDLAADVAAFMDALALESAIVVGHSMGSVVAQRFAIDHPDRLRGLVLVGSFASMPKNPAVRELWDSVVSKLTDPVDPGFVREFQQSAVARPLPPGFFDTVVRESQKLPARVWQGVVEGALRDDVSEELDAIAAPTLIVWGDRDKYSLRSDQEAQTAAIEGARLVVYHGAGHAPNWEEPDRLSSDLTAFVGFAGAPG